MSRKTFNVIITPVLAGATGMRLVTASAPFDYAAGAFALLVLTVIAVWGILK
jgi:hypothetical protein